MDMDNVELLPVDKKNMTAAEFLEDLALAARKYPEHFEKFVLVHSWLNPKIQTRVACYGVTTMEGFGLLHLGQLRLHDITTR